MAWEKDTLGRQQFGKHFIELLTTRYESRKSFIANLDAPWGHGKTFFLENLAEQLRQEGRTVAYVNAWRDDRTNAPLVAVLAAITEAISSQVGPASKAAITLTAARRRLAPVIAEVGKQVGKHALKLATGVAIDKVLDVMSLDEQYAADDGAIDKGVDAVTSRQVAAYVEDRLRSQEIERQAIESFKHQTAIALIEIKNTSAIIRNS